MDPSTGIEQTHYEGENERTLFRAVVYQALLDASSADSPNKENINVKQDAVRWFTKSNCVTASWFIDVCDLASLNFERVRGFARKLIFEPDDVDFERKRLNVLLNMRNGEDND